MVKGVVSSNHINGNKSKWSFLLVKTNADIDIYTTRILSDNVVGVRIISTGQIPPIMHMVLTQ